MANLLKVIIFFNYQGYFYSNYFIIIFTIQVNFSPIIVHFLFSEFNFNFLNFVKFFTFFNALK
jgi:hypothetical protein